MEINFVVRKTAADLLKRIGNTMATIDESELVIELAASTLGHKVIWHNSTNGLGDSSQAEDEAVEEVLDLAGQGCGIGSYRTFAEERGDA